MLSEYMIMSLFVLALYTRSSTHLKLRHTLSRTNSARHFYFNRIPRLCNTLPTIDLDQSTTSIKRKVRQFLWDYFMRAFKSDNPCLFHLLCPCSKCSCSSVTSSSLQVISFSYWTFSRMGVLDTLLEVC